jgi:hypothetical protein
MTVKTMEDLFELLAKLEGESNGVLDPEYAGQRVELMLAFPDH